MKQLRNTPKNCIFFERCALEKNKEIMFILNKEFTIKIRNDVTRRFKCNPEMPTNKWERWNFKDVENDNFSQERLNSFCKIVLGRTCIVFKVAESVHADV